MNGRNNKIKAIKPKETVNLVSRKNVYISWFVKEIKWYRIKRQIDDIPKCILEGYDIGISITLTNDKEMERINEKYHNQKASAEYLVFPNSIHLNDIRIIGDIFISYNQMVQEAKKNGKSAKYYCQNVLITSLLDLVFHDPILKEHIYSIQEKAREFII